MEHSPFPIFLDANIFIYAIGRDHPYQAPCRRIVNDLIPRAPDDFVTDAEVLQELLHRYVGIRDIAAAQRVVLWVHALMAGGIEPLLGEDVLRAATFAGDYPRLSARDLVHLAVMERLGTARFASADRGFDGIAWLARLDPLALDSWADSVRDEPPDG